MKDDNSRVTNRPVRTPIHKAKLLSAATRDGFVRRIVNDEPGRIPLFLGAGWTHVLDTDANLSDKTAQTASQQGSPVKYLVNKDARATSQYAYLMEIPQELWDADQEDMQNEINKKEAEIDPSKYKQGSMDYGSMSIKNK